MLDREGRIAWRRPAPTPAGDIIPVLETLLAEPIPADILANPPVTDLPLDVLKAPGLPENQIPDSILRGLGCAVYPDRVHLAATVGVSEVYIAQGPSDQFINWTHNTNGPGGGGGCSPAAHILQRLTKNKLTELAGQSEPGEPWSVLLVADGYSVVTIDGRPLPVVNNVVVVKGAGYIGEARLDGPAGSFDFRNPFGPPPRLLPQAPPPPMP